MTDPTPPRTMPREATRPRRLPRLVIVALAFIAVAALVLALMTLTPPPTRYHRYVSPPLPDGTRYTFLYPAHLRPMSGRPRTEFIAISDGSITAGPFLRVTLWLRRFIQRPTGYEMLSTQVLPSPPPSTHWRRLGSAGREQERREIQESRSGMNIHVLLVSDAHSQHRFIFDHNASGRTAAFRRDDATIIHSFRVLAPGEKAPN